MIEYSNRGAQMVLKIFRMRGSVFPNALLVALPNACITCLLTFMLNKFRNVSWLTNLFDVDCTIWNGFTFLVGFLLVFRTSQSYNRFWDGCTAVHKMSASFFECCGAVTAFTKYSDAPPEEIQAFLQLLVRLFSMLHVSALAQLEDTDQSAHIRAWSYDIVDISGIDDESLRTLEQSTSKTELVAQWIEQLIVSNIKTQVLSVPSPILSRCFQTLSNGMIHFHEALRVSRIPFPFPYAQVCDTVLVLHWMLLPFAVSSRTSQEWWAACFSFVQVFFVWCLTFIAIELEQPFGSDANDLDSMDLQVEANKHLVMLIQPSTRRTPQLAESCDPTVSLSRLLPRPDNLHRVDSFISGLSECTTSRASNLSQAWRRSSTSSSSSKHTSATLPGNRSSVRFSFAESSMPPADACTIMCSDRPSSESSTVAAVPDEAVAKSRADFDSSLALQGIPVVAPPELHGIPVVAPPEEAPALEDWMSPDGSSTSVASSPAPCSPRQLRSLTIHHHQRSGVHAQARELCESRKPCGDCSDTPVCPVLLGGPFQGVQADPFDGKREGQQACD